MRPVGPNQQSQNQQQHNNSQRPAPMLQSQDQSKQQGQLPNQPRPAQRGGCRRCGSYEHLVKECPHPPGSQSFFQAALLAFNQMDYIAAGKNAYQALFFHRNTEKLNEKDLKVLSDICYTLGQHRQSPAPVVPVTPVHHATDQSYPQNGVCAMQTEHPDLMTFDDTPANSQDFIPGV